jgi:hypothetical protein
LAAQRGGRRLEVPHVGDNGVQLAQAAGRGLIITIHGRGTLVKPAE